MGKNSHEQQNGNSNSATQSPGQINLLTAKHVLRPQINFRDRIDNSLNPFNLSVIARQLI